METTKCNLCASDQATLLYRLPDYLLQRDDIITTLVRCSQCGLVYQNPRPTELEIGAHYPPDYEPFESSPQKGKMAWIENRLRNYGIQKRCRIVTRVISRGKVLDVGCATGLFLVGMRERHWDVYGVDTSEYAAQIAREEHNLRVITGNLFEAQYPSAFFDAVTLWDVLEHLHDPARILYEIRRILKPNGVLILRVPNIDSSDARFFGKYWAGLDAPRHLYVFGDETIRKFLSRYGFSITSVEKNLGNYPGFVLSLRFAMHGGGIKISNQKRAVRILLHPITRVITAPVFFLRGFFTSGPSLVITARKIEEFRISSDENRNHP